MNQSIETVERWGRTEVWTWTEINNETIVLEIQRNYEDGNEAYDYYACKNREVTPLDEQEYRLYRRFAIS